MSEAVDTFIDALWLEEGLSRNTLAAYRRDLELYERWLSQRGSHLPATSEADLHGYFAARHADSKATSANRRLTDSTPGPATPMAPNVTPFPDRPSRRFAH